MEKFPLPRLRDYFEERATATEDLRRRIRSGERGAAEPLVRQTLRIAEKAINARSGSNLFIELSVWVDCDEPRILAYYDTGGSTRPRTDAKRSANPRYYRESKYDVIPLLESPTAEPVFKARVTSSNYAFASSAQETRIKSTFLHCLDLARPAALVATANLPEALTPDTVPVDLIYSLGLAVRADLHLDLMEEQNMRKKPTVFIGSSKEGKDVAAKLQTDLDHDVDCTIWHDGVFGLSGGTLESLVAALNDFDFAVLVITPDDMVRKRGEEKQIARDNVIFELGLFMGALGRDRTYYLHCRDDEIEFPSDLAGIKGATFGRRDNLAAALRPAATDILDRIKKLGPRRI